MKEINVTTAFPVAVSCPGDDTATCKSNLRADAVADRGEKVKSSAANSRCPGSAHVPQPLAQDGREMVDEASHFCGDEAIGRVDGVDAAFR